MDEELLCRAAVDVFGVKAQMQQAMEECGELIVAISHYQRNPSQDNYYKLLDEIADVGIMVAQLGYIVGMDQVGARREYKLERLRVELEAREWGHETNTADRHKKVLE